MKNPTDWQATSWSYDKPIDKSGPSKELAKNGARPDTVEATPHDHFAPTPLSGSGYPELHNGSTLMGNPVANDERSWSAPSMAMPGPTPKSLPDVPDSPKSWKSKNYDMSCPSTDSEGASAYKKIWSSK